MTPLSFFSSPLFHLTHFWEIYSDFYSKSPTEKKESYFLFKQIAKVKKTKLFSIPSCTSFFFLKKIPQLILVLFSFEPAHFLYDSITSTLNKPWSKQVYKSACVCFDLPSTVKSFVSQVHLSAKDLSSVLYKPLTTPLCLATEYNTITLLYCITVSLCVCVETVCVCVCGLGHLLNIRKRHQILKSHLEQWR